MRTTLLVLCSAAALASARAGAQVTPQPVPGTTSSAPTIGGTQPGIGRRMGRRGGRHGGMASAMLRDITLSDAQRTQLATVERRYRDERRSLRGPRSGAANGAVVRDTATRTAMRSLREREMADVRGVLTSSQQSTFDRNVQQWRATARQRHATRGAAGTAR